MTPGGSSAHKRLATPGTPMSKVVSFDDLDDTVTMLADIKSVLAGAQVSLMELSETLKSVYEDDPPI